MTSIHTYEAGTGAPAAAAAADRRAGSWRSQPAPRGGPAPRSPGTSLCSIPKQIGVQFASVKPSMQAVARWARRFGGIVTTETRPAKTRPETWCTTKFSYYGVTMKAYARVPAEPASN